MNALPAWPADRVERRPLAELMAYAQNARVHTPEQIDQVVASIRQWGWTVPVLVDEAGMIIAGHARCLAAAKLELAEVPVMVARGWSDEQKRAYVLADNQIATNSSWDPELLRAELTALQAADFGAGLMGFSAADLTDLFGVDGPGGNGRAGNLVERFGVAPFSVLNAREGWWQERKRAWLALGIRSEIGRGDDHSSDFGRSGAVMPTHGGGLNQQLARARGYDRANATPGGSARPAADYGKTRARGDGAGRAMKRDSDAA